MVAVGVVGALAHMTRLGQKVHRSKQNAVRALDERMRAEIEDLGREEDRREELEKLKD